MSHARAPFKTGPINYADVYDADGNVVALVPKGFTWTIDTARLIIAAPYLLEALREMIAAAELEGISSQRFFEARDAGVAAIAKAEGKL